MAKKYYWLKLKEDFFQEDTIAWIEEQEKGKEYTLFYLKLCLKSLKTNGILIRRVGSMLVPYDTKQLSKITNTDLDTVIVSMELFKKIGLVEILENGEIYLPELEKMVGSETSKAQLMRNKRARDKEEKEQKKLNGNNVTNTLPKRYTEIEKEIEKETEIDIEQQQEKEKDFVVVVDKIKEFFLLSEDDIKKVASAHLATNKEIGYLEEKLLIAKETDTKNLVGFILEAIKKDYKPIITNNQEKKHKTKFHNCNSTFNNYTEEELEEFLLNQQKIKWEQ